MTNANTASLHGFADVGRGETCEDEDMVASGSSAAAAGGRLLSFHDKRRVLGLEEGEAKRRASLAPRGESR